MALKPCRECKSLVSNEAKVCPNCGVAKPIKRRATWIWVALGFVILFIVVSPKNDQPSNDSKSVSASTNEINAETVARAKKQMEAAMQDPRKVRLMECIGVNPWKVKPVGWAPPSEEECDRLKQVLGAEADARERSMQKD